MFIFEHNTAIDMLITFVPNTGTSALSLDYRDTDNTRRFQTDLYNNNLYSDYSRACAYIKTDWKIRKKVCTGGYEFLTF